MYKSISVLSIASLFVFAFALASCGSSSSSTGTIGETGIAVSETYSADAAFASPFENGSGSSLVIDRKFSAVQTYAERREAVQALLSEESDSGNCSFDFDLSINGSSSAACYGPNVDLTGTHPDTSSAVSKVELPSGDLGIWDATDSATEDACTAAQVNSLVDGYAGYSHFSNLLGAALNCYVRNTSSLSFPETATTNLELDETALTAFEEILSGGGDDTYTVSSAVVSLIEDADGNNGFRYQISGNWTDSTLSGPGKEIGYTIVAQHLVPSDGKLKGSLSYSLQIEGETPRGNCSDAGGDAESEGMTFGGDLTYNKNSDTEVVIEFNHADFCGVSDPLGDASSNFAIDPCNFVGSGGDVVSTGWANNWNRGTFSFDPATTDGTYAYSWSAGWNDRNTRVFNATISTSGTTRTGTGYFGYGPSFPSNRDTRSSCSGFAEGVGEIDGMICNWAGDGQLSDGSEVKEYVQKQVMTLDTSTDGASWTATESKIEYAPVNACTYTGFGDFTYINENAATDTMTNDSDQAGAATLNLEAYSNYSFTVPSSPSLSIVVE